MKKIKKLIKINPDHFVVVDDSEIKKGDWYLCWESKSVPTDYTIDNTFSHWIIGADNYKKITHSTQPLELTDWENGAVGKRPAFDKIQYLSLKEVKELIGEVDVYIVDDKALEHWTNESKPFKDVSDYTDFNYGYHKGYAQAIEDNKKREYTEEDMRKAIEMARQKEPYKHDGKSCEYLFQDAIAIIQSLQTPTEWEVEFDERGKLKLV